MQDLKVSEQIEFGSLNVIVSLKNNTQDIYVGHLRFFNFFYYIDHVNNPSYDFCLDIFP